jgi:hypothetical protein
MTTIFPAMIANRAGESLAAMFDALAADGLARIVADECPCEIRIRACDALRDIAEHGEPSDDRDTVALFALAAHRAVDADTERAIFDAYDEHDAGTPGYVFACAAIRRSAAARHAAVTRATGVRHPERTACRWH